MSEATPRGGHSGWLMVLVVVTAVILVILGTYKVWYHYQTVGLGYQLAEQTVSHRQLFGKNRMLRIELASLKRDGLQRLRTSATLGVLEGESGETKDRPPPMRTPGPEDLIVVQP